MHDNTKVTQHVTNRYLGTAAVGAWFDVKGETVLRWLERYEDFPQPDAETSNGRGSTPGWSPHRKAEIMRWYNTSPHRKSRAWKHGSGSVSDESARG